MKTDFEIDGKKGFFWKVPNDASNFRILSDKKLDITELCFDDPTKYCLYKDAPMFKGVYELSGFTTIQGQKYAILIEA